MPGEQVKVLGCRVDRIDMNQAVQKIAEMIAAGKGCHQVITLNAEIIYQAVNDPELTRMINQADLVTPDGAGVVWAARYLRNPVQERVTGIDLLTRLAEEGAKRGWSFFFLGAAPGVAEDAAQKLRLRFPDLKINGTMHGYFKPEDEAEVIKAINQSQSDILLVGLGAPRQDWWIAQHKSQLECRVAIGVGGSFDVLAERLNRAPEWMIKANLEWLYRLIKEPSRWRRQMALPRFVLLVMRRGREYISEREQVL